MAFKVGDKVEHRSFGAGEIVFGPYQRGGHAKNYLMKEAATGDHRLVEADAMSPAAKFKIGDKVRSGVVEYTVKGGPFFGPTHEWYAITTAEGTDYQSNASWLTAVEPAAEANTHVHHGVTYDLDARYRDTDGDVWRFARQGDGKILGTYFNRDVSQYDEELSSVVHEYGPLTKI
jgi:heat shock protein HspQ